MEKKLTLKTGGFNSLIVELDVFLSEPSVDMYLSHCVKKIKKAVKPIIDDYDETKKEIIKKYATGDDNFIASHLGVTEEELKTISMEELEKKEKNPNFEPCMREIEKILEKEETVTISTIDANEFKKFPNSLFTESFKRSKELFGVTEFNFIYEVLD